MSKCARYDTIGLNYADLRRPDPRIASHIDAALCDARQIVNVGAGAGSYEPTARDVVAVEPSAEMIAQRAADAAPAIQGSAENLPFDDDSFDAAIGVGLSEMRRVSRGPVVLLTFDVAFRDIWLLDYLPQLAALDEQQMPPMDDYERWLGPADIVPVPIPHDCTDGFLYAYWRRPAAYLDPRIRKGSSSFWAIDGAEEGLARLEADLASGAWEDRYGHLLERDAIDLGYRLVVSPG